MESGNQAYAYRQAFNVAPTTKAETVWRAACGLAQNSKVAARIAELRADANLRTVTSVEEMLRWYYDVATADPNEIVCRVQLNCRHCHGDGFGYQWRDAKEYAEACDAVLQKNATLPARYTGPREALPNCDGGFGFVGNAEPNPLCPWCFGQGVGETRIADTTKLTGKARRLYKGIKETRNGVEVLLHDQKAAADSIVSILGGFKAWQPAAPPAPPGAGHINTTDPAEAAKAYLSLVS